MFRIKWAGRVLISASLIVAAATAGAQNSGTGGNALTAAQKQAIQQKLQALDSSSKAQTEQLTAKVAAIAKDIDRNLLSANPDEALDRKLSADFAAAVTQMVSGAIEAKLATMREIVKILTPEQKTVLMAEVEKPGANPDLSELIGKVFGK